MDARKTGLVGATKATRALFENSLPLFLAFMALPALRCLEIERLSLRRRVGSADD